MAELSSILGEGYSMKNLKPFGKIIRNRLLKSKDRQPWVQLVITSNGEKYKVLKIDSSSNNRLKNMLNLRRWYEVLEFVPEIVWSDENMIISKFIEGTFPQFEDGHFSKEFGKNMAILHKTNVGTADKEEYLLRIIEYLDFLTSKNAISLEMKNKSREKILNLQPDELRTSMTYSNMHNEENYIIDANKKLWFIDLGSFKEKRVTDDALFGYRIFKYIDKKAFWEGYFESGGTDYLRKNQNFLKLVQYIRKGARHLQIFYDLPFSNFREKRARLRRARWVINELINELSKR
jgi:hypothetical protein